MPLIDEKARILSNEQVGPELFLMRLESPLLARGMEPGQFVHMKICGMEDHILRRPFSIYDTDPDAGTMDILYRTVGFGSGHMSNLAEGEVSMMGPIGTGWELPEGAVKPLIVGGGVGAAPVFMFVKELVARGLKPTVVLGAQTADMLVCRERFTEALGSEPICTTDDGSYGIGGFCTVPVEELLSKAEEAGEPYDYVAVCGPEVLMKLIAQSASNHGVACQVSMEKRMACGIGACLSCVVDTVSGKKRACVDGPVFDASEVIW